MSELLQSIREATQTEEIDVFDEATHELTPGDPVIVDGTEYEVHNVTPGRLYLHDDAGQTKILGLSADPDIPLVFGGVSTFERGSAREQAVESVSLDPSRQSEDSPTQKDASEAEQTADS